jgi:lipopolysaccharide export system protein LptA
MRRMRVISFLLLNKKYPLLGVLLCISILDYAATKDYNISTENAFTGGAAYCQGQTATLSVTFNVCNYGSGASNAGTITITWYSNTSNSTSGGTQVSQSTNVSTGTGSTISYNYSPSTATNGTLYYYVTISAPTNTGCGFTTTLTTASTQTITVSQCDRTSVSGGGNWNTAATWVEGSVPQSYHHVTIVDGATVTIDATANAYNLYVGQGTSGVLQFQSGTARTLTVANDVTIASGGIFQSATSGTITTHTLSIAGNLTNNGTLDFSTNSNTAGAGITFTSSNNTSFSGTGGVTDVRTITINKGTSSTPVLELSPTNFTVRGVTTDVAGFLTLTNGTFKISGSFTVSNRVFTSAAYTIGSTTGFYLNNSNFTVSAQASDCYINAGVLTIDAGTYNVGTSTGNAFLYYANSTVVINGGSMNIASNFYSMSGGTVAYTQTGGTLTTCTVGLTLAQPSFYLTSGSSCTMSGGSIILRLANTGASKYDYDNSAGTRNMTGGTLQLGDASSGAAKTFVITGYFPNLLITNTSGNHTAKTYNFGAANQVILTTVLQDNTTFDANSNSSSFTFSGNVTLGSGTSFLAGSGTQTVNGDWSNAGTITPSTGTFVFSGSSNQSIAGAATSSFYNLTNSNTSTGITLNANIGVSNTLNMNGATADIDLNGYNIDLSSTGTLTGESNSDRIKGATGTISTVRALNNITALDVAGLGLEITTASDLGTATLSRGHTPQDGILDHTGIRRYYSLSYTVGGNKNGTLVMNYFENELTADQSSNEASFYAFRANNTGSTYGQTPSTVNTTTNKVTVTSLNKLSTLWTISNIVTQFLAVELESFSANYVNNQLVLFWDCSSQKENDYFTIERSMDGFNFAEIGIIDGAGTTDQFLSYTFIDEESLEDVNYYRLKMTDYNGKSEYSKIVSYNFSKKSKVLLISIDILGQEVQSGYRGLVFDYYSDGTTTKRMQ